MSKKLMRRTVSTAAMAVSSSVCSAAFTNNTIALVRVGDGTQALTGSTALATAAAPVFIDFYNITTGSLVSSINMPIAGSNVFTLGARADNHDGHLNLSPNHDWLTLGGYRALPTAANPITATAASVPRVVGRIDGNLNIDTTTQSSSAYNGVTITSVATDNGQRFWTGGSSQSSITFSGGLRFVPSPGSTASYNIGSTQLTGTGLEADSLRNIRIQQNAVSGQSQLYLDTASQGSYVDRGAFKTATPLPVVSQDTVVAANPVIRNFTGQTTDRDGNPDDGSGKFYPKSDCLFIDTLGTGTYNLAYGTGGKADIEKFVLQDDGKWKRVDQANIAGREVNALDYVTDGTTRTVFASTDEGVYKFTDTGLLSITDPNLAAPNSENLRLLSPAQSLFFTPLVGTQFRGLAVIVPEPAMVAFAMTAAFTLRRRRKLPA